MIDIDIYRYIDIYSMSITLPRYERVQESMLPRTKITAAAPRPKAPCFTRAGAGIPEKIRHGYWIPWISLDATALHFDSAAVVRHKQRICPRQIKLACQMANMTGRCGRAKTASTREAASMSLNGC